MVMLGQGELEAAGEVDWSWWLQENCGQDAMHNRCIQQQHEKSQDTFMRDS
jgi:hypothetical protein